LSDIGRAEWRHFLEIYERDDDGTPVRVTIDLDAKVKSLEPLGKHRQLFSDNLNLSGGIEIREYVGIPEDVQWAVLAHRCLHPNSTADRPSTPVGRS
jgi:hypothetical protein